MSTSFRTRAGPSAAVCMETKAPMEWPTRSNASIPSWVAAALKASITRRELEARAEAIIEAVRSAGGNLGVTSGRQAIEEGAEALAARNIIHVERGGRFRVRERTVLRYYARGLQHLLAGPRRAPRTH